MDCPICHKSFASRYSRERHAKLVHPDTSGIAAKDEDRIKEEPNNVFDDSLESAPSNPEPLDDDEDKDEATDSEDDAEEIQSTDVDMDTEEK